MKEECSIEKWKPVPEYEGLYDISNCGKVFSHYTNSILKGGIDTDGYCYFAAYKNGKRKNVLIHRAVAFAFLENPNNYPTINHKDENTQNNHVENLEWCTVSYNNSYNNVRKRTSATKKRVYQYDLFGNLIAEFESSNEAARAINGSSGCMSECCNGKLKTYRGYVFSFVPLSKDSVLLRTNYKSCS